MTNNNPGENKVLPEILFISSYPPRECGIATYSQDLKRAMDNKFSNSFTIKVCALESEHEKHTYSGEVNYTLNTDQPGSFSSLAIKINHNREMQMVLIQHEFGLFRNRRDELVKFLTALTKPAFIVFHTILPNPEESLKEHVGKIAILAESVIVMTHSSAAILTRDYGLAPGKITIIPHGTHLVQQVDKSSLKIKYHVEGKKVLSTFGLLSPGKSIETTLEALPAVIKENPDVIFLVIGKTHPAVVKQEAEKYRTMLEAKVAALHLQQHVQFINRFLVLSDLLEYLQLSDIYLFTSKDPNQAVSGTFSYAISCGCPVISTPIPHAREVVKNDAGVMVDFENSSQLSNAINKLLADETLRKNIGSNGLHRMASTAWENTAIAHAMLFEKIRSSDITLQYNVPEINLAHLKKMTTSAGMIQFAELNNPDITSGYTLDDNARAMIATCRHFEITGDTSGIEYIRIYLDFTGYCQQADGSFLNYVDAEKRFTPQNDSTNLEDSNGRAIWGVGYLLSLRHLLPADLILSAESIMQAALGNVNRIHSARAMAFIIKGLYYQNAKSRSEQRLLLVKELANRLVQMYRHEKKTDWQWFESYLTYANSILPESMLLAWVLTGDTTYKEVARTSFDFLLSKTFTGNSIRVISNKSWLYRNQAPSPAVPGGEQPIDVAYTILALRQFYKVFRAEHYRDKMETAFNWFLGNNHLHQVIYNPCTGGCYDGLEENYVNLNQGAESTISYLLARMELDFRSSDLPVPRKRKRIGSKEVPELDTQHS